jgi:hypothetical protein
VQGIKRILDFFNDYCTFINRNTSSKDVLEAYGDKNQKMKSKLTQIYGKVCLNSDCWTTCTNESNISLSAHYVDVNWKLKSKILGFYRMGSPT